MQAFSDLLAHFSIWMLAPLYLAKIVLTYVIYRVWRNWRGPLGQRSKT